MTPDEREDVRQQVLAFFAMKRKFGTESGIAAAHALLLVDWLPVLLRDLETAEAGNAALRATLAEFEAAFERVARYVDLESGAGLQDSARTRQEARSGVPTPTPALGATDEDRSPS